MILLKYTRSRRGRDGTLCDAILFLSILVVVLLFLSILHFLIGVPRTLPMLKDLGGITSIVAVQRLLLGRWSLPEDSKVDGIMIVKTLLSLLLGSMIWILLCGLLNIL